MTAALVLLAVPASLLGVFLSTVASNQIVSYINETEFLQCDLSSFPNLFKLY